jgi:predicted nuclease of predicted toxin-antitoxin system
MRFLVDEQLPPALASWLCHKGHIAEHVVALGFGGASDRAIWELAIRLDAVVVTKDEDFSRFRLAAKGGPKVVWLRVPNTRTVELLNWLDNLLPAICRAIEAGQALVEID